MRRSLTGLILLCGSLTAQSTDAMQQVRERFQLCATRAIAVFQSADRIASDLANEGLLLTPELQILRLDVERALDRTEALLARGDRIAAQRTLTRAEGLLARYSGKLGAK